MKTDKISDFVSENWDSIVVPTLQSYIEIPNKSPAFDSEWQVHGHMQQAVQLFADAVDRYSLAEVEKKIVTLTQRTPLLLLDVPATAGAKGNVLLYGHYDKQPEFAGWREGLGPWQPVIENGRLYGRGGADDGYALFGCLAAIEALEKQGIAHPRCLILIEGCEESGSYDLPFYIEEIKDIIGEPDLLICLDAECGNYDQLWLTTSLRGMLSGTLTVKVLTEGIHSGGAGGIVPSSFRIMRNVLERIEDAASGDLDDVLHGEIPDWVHDQSNNVVKTIGNEVINRYPWHGSTQAPTTDLTDLVTRNSWGPSMATVGLGGAPTPPNAGNTLRPSTSAKLVFRLPPNVDGTRAGKTVKSILEEDPPYGASVTFDIDAAEAGWFANPLRPWLRDAVDQASNIYFGKPHQLMGCGGTIPFMTILGRQFPNCEFVVTGVLGPHSNAHGPNEFLDIDTGKAVTCCIAHVLASAAENF